MASFFNLHLLWVTHLISHHWVWLPSLSSAVGLSRHHYQAWLTIHSFGSSQGLTGLLFFFLRMLRNTFLLFAVPHDHQLICGSVREWCWGKGERRKKGRMRKLPNNVALLIGKLKYYLFRKMLIQQSLLPCLLKGPADSQSEREGERRGEMIRSVKANLQSMHRGRRQQPNQSVPSGSGNQGCQTISCLFHSIRCLYIYPAGPPKFSNEGLTVYINTQFFI